MITTYVGLIDTTEKEREINSTHSLTTYIDCTMETEYDTRADRLTSPANVYGPYRNKASIGVKAVWDTGSRTSCISRRLAKELDLQETGRMIVITPSGTIEMPVHRIDLVLWEDLSFNDLAVVEYPLENHDCDILIGMDVISRGKLTVDSREGKTRITFSM